MHREKLAFLVDATSAPDASIVPLSSWIGFELQQIQQQLDIIKDNNGGAMPEGLTDNAFVFFVVTIPTRLYVSVSDYYNIPAGYLYLYHHVDLIYDYIKFYDKLVDDHYYDNFVYNKRDQS